MFHYADVCRGQSQRQLLSLTQEGFLHLCVRLAFPIWEKNMIFKDK